MFTITDNGSTHLGWGRSAGQIFFSGDLKSGRLYLEVSPDGGTTWVEAGFETSFEGVLAGAGEFAAACDDIRVTLEDASGPTSIKVWVHGLR